MDRLGFITSACFGFAIHIAWGNTEGSTHSAHRGRMPGCWTRASRTPRAASCTFFSTPKSDQADVRPTACAQARGFFIVSYSKIPTTKLPRGVAIRPRPSARSRRAFARPVPPPCSSGMVMARLVLTALLLTLAVLPGADGFQTALVRPQPLLSSRALASQGPTRPFRSADADAVSCGGPRCLLQGQGAEETGIPHWGGRGGEGGRGAWNCRGHVAGGSDGEGAPSGRTTRLSLGGGILVARRDRRSGHSWGMGGAAAATQV